MATVRKRGTTRPFRWEAQVRMRGWPTQTKTFPAKADAEQWASEREAEMRRGTFVDTSNLRTTTVYQLLARYLAEVTPKKKGKAPEGYRLQAMMRLPLAQLTLDRMNTAVVVEWRKARTSVVSDSTVRREMSLLSRVFRLARGEWGYPLENPLKDVDRPTEAPGRERRPNWKELRKLLRELTPRADNPHLGRTRNPWVKPVVVLALRTAMRRGEILSMQWENVDFGERRVRLPDTKGGVPRDVPLSRKAEQLLKRLPVESRTGAVFPLTMEAFKQAFSGARDRTGIKNLRFHDFRHEATTRMAERFPNILQLSAVTGHRDPRMLKRYYNPKASELARKLD